MRTFITIIAGLIISWDTFSQVDPKKNVYPKLDTLSTINFGLSSEINSIDSIYFVNKKKVDKETYDFYDSLWKNILRCTPCYLKTYDINNILVSESVQYGDCLVGIWTSYYPNGQIKMTGNYKQNSTGNWTDIYNRGLCSKKIGDWTFYKENGEKDRIEKYEQGKLTETLLFGKPVH